MRLSRLSKMRHARACLALCVALGATAACGPEEIGGARDEAMASEEVAVQEHALSAGFGAVHGYVDGIVDDRNKTAMALPDARVQLRRVTDGFLTPPVFTDTKGYFIAGDVPMGSYVICASAHAFPSACGSTSFVVKSRRIANPAHALLRSSPRVIFGRVRLSDGKSPFYENALFSTEVVTRVQAFTSSGASATTPVRANVEGQYALGPVAAGAYTLRVTSDSYVSNVAVTVTSASLAKDVVIANRRPTTLEVNALRAGKTVRHVDPGSAYIVSAAGRDPDGSALHYKWRATSGSCVAADAATTTCTAPPNQGIQEVYVQITDTRGQYSTGRARVSVGAATARFTGRVVSAAGVAQPGATVMVNGVGASSGADGAFMVSLPETNRYALTIQKAGFQLYSKVFLAERSGGTYALRPATKTVIDPNVENVITVVTPRGQKADPYGKVTVRLRARSIVNALGQSVTTPVTVYHSRFDHLFDTSDPMPGDYGAVARSGADVTLTSFGAIDMTLTDGGSQKYNLAPGMPAELSYPIHPDQLASAPSELPLWYYDTSRGLWLEEGVATRTGSQYIALAAHFSAINVDLAKADATCVKLVVDPITAPPLPFNIRVAVPGSPTRDRSVTEDVSAVVRLPPNVPNTRITVLDPAGNPIPGSERVFTTGAAVPAGVNLSLAAPYNECVSAARPAVTLGIDLPQDPSLSYLSYISNDAAYADQYYAAISADPTLAIWKARNGFDAGDDARAFYFNRGDLEFGRSMHMRRRSDGGVAYYVTNFADADKAYAGSPADVIATVAMEYSSAPSTAPGALKFIKFYVYDAAGNLVNRAELDRRGDRFVPGLCMVCHGGTKPADITAAGGNLETRFIPFDLSSFDYPSALGRSAQEENFRELNEGLYFAYATTAQVALIDGWYQSNVAAPGGTQHDDSAHIPISWRASSAGSSAANEALYYEVLRPACRACHGSRTEDSSLDFGSPSLFTPRAPSVNAAVCSAGYMPQAFVTWRNFWRSGAPSVLGSYMLGAGVSDGTCTGP